MLLGSSHSLIVQEGTSRWKRLRLLKDKQQYGEKELVHKETKMMKALNDEFEVVSSFKSLNKCIELAKDMKLTELINPSSKITGDLAELIYRLQNLEEFEVLDFNNNEA